MHDTGETIAGVRIVAMGARTPADRPGFVVIDKPAGMLSVPGKFREGGDDKQDCAAARVRAAFPWCSGPLVVHRLDMDTSGLLVFGLTPESQRDLSMQFEARAVRKQYIALVHGVPPTAGLPAESGVFDAPMRADIDNRPMQIVDRIHGRESRTNWRVLSIETDRTRLLLEPLTGRTHQLRVHCAHSGHPILGDVLYGPPAPDNAEGHGSSRLMLHASLLAFREPWQHGVEREFRSTPPF